MQNRFFACDAKKSRFVIGGSTEKSAYILRQKRGQKGIRGNFIWTAPSHLLRDALLQRPGAPGSVRQRTYGECVW